MKYGRLRKALLAAGCTWKDGKGDHQKWFCPCGDHIVVVTQGGTVSPGVVADVISSFACMRKGWLQ